MNFSLSRATIATYRIGPDNLLIVFSISWSRRTFAPPLPMILPIRHGSGVGQASGNASRDASGALHQWLRLGQDQHANTEDSGDAFVIDRDLLLWIVHF